MKTIRSTDIVFFKGTWEIELAMRTTHTYKPKYSHSTSLSIAQKKKDERRKGIREMLDAEEREWNAEDA
ncbi:MAG: hypothetical protein F6J94_31765, partial [Moorea sp. SIO1F2]|uniref:hypothetical protein n=1 Tax=Moorena sp. SIO1F2 TaxID=2607819 RepID=UPI0013B7B916